MGILVIVVTYNAIKWVDHCLTSLYTSSFKPDVYVIDNGSIDGTQSFVQKQFPQVRFLQNEVNLGFGKANNIGLQYAIDNNYEYVYLLNQDAWVMEDTLEKLISISKRYPKYGILSPLQMNDIEKQMDSSFLNSVCISNSIKNILADMFSGQMKDVYDVPYIMAAHWFISRDCIKIVGGFSPSFPHYGEDNNYANRVIYRGYKIGIVPSLRVVHDRANRQVSKTKSMYLSYIYCVAKLSNTSRSIKNSLLSCVVLQVSNACKYKSLRPLGFLYKIIRDYRSIVKMRRISMEQNGAFLNV